MQNKKYKLMEWHRDEFIPVKSTKPNGEKGDEKIVTISTKDAEELNRDFNKARGVGTKLKYIEADDEVATKKQEVAKNEEVAIKKPVAPKKEPTDNLDELKKVQEEYAKLFGKKVFYAWTIEQIKEKIENK